MEIKVSTDTTNGIDGTWTPSGADWMKVPIEGQPLMDGAVIPKGNGDDAFDKNTQKFIELTHIRYRITLRDNETPLPLP